MVTVIVRYTIIVVDDEAIKNLWDTGSAKEDLNVEIPGLPGVTLGEVLSSDISKGHEPLKISGLRDRIAVAIGGEPPTKVLLVRQGGVIDTRAKDSAPS